MDFHRKNIRMKLLKSFIFNQHFLITVTFKQTIKNLVYICIKIPLKVSIIIILYMIRLIKFNFINLLLIVPNIELSVTSGNINESTNKSLLFTRIFGKVTVYSLD